MDNDINITDLKLTRIKFWCDFFTAASFSQFANRAMGKGYEFDPTVLADKALAEFDKRFNNATPS